MIDKKIKAREDRIRRKLKKQGYALVKNRAYTHLERFQGEYMISNPYNNTGVAGCEGNGFSLSLEEVENWADS
jgi:hypothetical protein